jgi:flagellar biogenesis protein FliO
LSLTEWFVVGIIFLILAFVCFVIWVFQSFKPEK